MIGSNGKLIENKDFKSELPFIFGDLDISEFLKLKKKIDSSLFEFSEISNLYQYKSNRWDIETRNGNLIKLPKKKQDLRVDLPTIGLKTIKQSKIAGLKGIVVKSKQHVFLDKSKCINFANKNRMFISVK